MAKKKAPKTFLEKLSEKAGHVKEDILAGKDHLMEVAGDAIASVKHSIDEFKAKKVVKASGKKTTLKKAAAKKAAPAKKKIAKKAVAVKKSVKGKAVTAKKAVKKTVKKTAKKS